MTARESLHRIVDDLQEEDLLTARRLLEKLRATADPLLKTLLSAPTDEEPDDDDFDGGLSEARREAQDARTTTHEDVKHQLG